MAKPSTPPKDAKPTTPAKAKATSVRNAVSTANRANETKRTNQPDTANTARASANGFTVPGLAKRDGSAIAGVLQERLVSLIDLSLTLKHIHWNVVGPTFIGVHLMLDPQVDGVAAMVDETAERIASLGGSPNGLPGNVVEKRTWNDYSLLRALVPEHLGALDLVYTGVIDSHRDAIEAVDLDPISVDLLVRQTGTLELYQWFVRAHLESASGVLATQGDRTERNAANSAKRA
jgi:starvation-inducible DNA-binding protein